MADFVPVCDLPLTVRDALSLAAQAVHLVDVVAAVTPSDVSVLSPEGRIRDELAALRPVLGQHMLAMLGKDPRGGAGQSGQQACAAASLAFRLSAAHTHPAVAGGRQALAQVSTAIAARHAPIATLPIPIIVPERQIITVRVPTMTTGRMVAFLAITTLMFGGAGYVLWKVS